MDKCPGFQFHVKPAMFENIFYPRLRQENPEFEATLGYQGILCLVGFCPPTPQYTMLLYFTNGQIFW